jgi:hypothetical protein
MIAPILNCNEVLNGATSQELPNEFKFVMPRRRN